MKTYNLSEDGIKDIVSLIMMKVSMAILSKDPDTLKPELLNRTVLNYLEMKSEETVG